MPRTPRSQLARSNSPTVQLKYKSALGILPGALFLSTTKKITRVVTAPDWSERSNPKKIPTHRSRQPKTQYPHGFPGVRDGPPHDSALPQLLPGQDDPNGSNSIGHRPNREQPSSTATPYPQRLGLRTGRSCFLLKTAASCHPALASNRFPGKPAKPKTAAWPRAGCKCGLISA